MLALVGFGVFMGILFAAPPGLVTAETVRRGVARGFSAALGVQLGSLIGDATYCVLALAGVAVLVQNPLTQRVLGIVSILFLAYLALSGLYTQFRAAPTGTATRIAPQEGRHAFLTGMLLSLTNPWAIGFWLSLGGTLAAYGVMDSRGTMAVFFASFFLACLAYALFVALLIGITRRTVPPTVGKWVSTICSIVIGLLAIGVAVQVWRTF